MADTSTSGTKSPRKNAPAATNNEGTTTQEVTPMAENVAGTYICNDECTAYFAPSLMAAQELIHIHVDDKVTLEEWTETHEGMVWGRFKTKSSLPNFGEQNYRYVVISDEKKRHENFTKQAA